MSFSVIWEYKVEPAKSADFERAYGGDGPWVDLFAKADGFLGTWLLRDKEHPGTYLSHDRWVSREAYQAFKRDFAVEYEAMDSDLDGLSSRETYVGSYDEIGG